MDRFCAALIFSAVVGFVPGCGGTRSTDRTSPGGAHALPTPSAKTKSKTKRREVAKPLVCPKAAAKKLVEGFRKPAELNQFEVVVVRQCLAGTFGQKPGFFVLATFGQPDDSKSEVGWTIYRFVMSAAGKLVAKGPVDGAGWLTGVPVGKVRFVDLDGDGSDEILEVLARSLFSPVATSTILTVWRRVAAKLIAVVAVPVVHVVGEIHDMTGEMDVSAIAKPNCVASYKLVAGPKRSRAIHLKYNNTVPDATKQRLSDKQLDVLVRKISAKLTSGSSPKSLGCLPSGTVRLRLVGGKLKVGWAP